MGYVFYLDGNGKESGLILQRIENFIYEKLKNIPFVYNRVSPKSIGQFLRYLIVGFTSFGIEYTLFILFRNWLSVSELLVNIGVYTVIFWLNFLLNRHFSFKSKSAFLPQILAYGVLFAFNLVVGNILLFSGIRYLLVMITNEGSWEVLYLPKILIMFFIVSWNFILYKKIIYKT